MTDQRCELSDRIITAFEFSFRLHRDQLRKGSQIPYMAHLLSVAALVLEDSGDEDEVIAALLHDAVEDQGGLATLNEIRQRFGERVAAVVEACSDSFTTPKPPWRERKEAYLHRLESADPSVLRVSMADKLHNLRCMKRDYTLLGEDVWKRFKGGKEGTLWYYQELSLIFHKHSENLMLREMDQILEDFLRLP
jgi:(p)ppGpp synthase/HD superfamily hydrolase